MSTKAAAYQITASSLLQQGYGRFLNAEQTAFTLPKSLTPSKIGLRIVSSSKEQASKMGQKVNKYAEEHSTVFRLGVNNTLIFEANQKASQINNDVTYAFGHLTSLNFDKVQKEPKPPKAKQVQPKSPKPTVDVIVLPQGVTTEMFLKNNEIRPPSQKTNPVTTPTPQPQSNTSSNPTPQVPSQLPVDEPASVESPVDEPASVESQGNCISRFFSSIWDCFVGAMRALGNFICCCKSGSGSTEAAKETISLPKQGDVAASTVEPNKKDSVEQRQVVEELILLA